MPSSPTNPDLPITPRPATPLFSFVIPVYNRAEGLHPTLDSILQQSFNDYEVIVIDDGSDDEPQRALEQYNDSRITFLRNPTNRGVGPTRNRGVRESKEIGRAHV